MMHIMPSSMHVICTSMVSWLSYAWLIKCAAPADLKGKNLKSYHVDTVPRYGILELWFPVRPA